VNDGNSEALLLRARSNFSLENFEDAVGDLRELLKKFPLNREARAMLNKAKVQLKKQDKENVENFNINVEVEVHSDDKIKSSENVNTPLRPQNT